MTSVENFSPVAPWILFTIFAALMQSVRTAGQKSLSNSITPMSATLVRYVFGLPIAIVYLIALSGGHTIDQLSHALTLSEFIWPAMLAGVFQIIATVLLILLFRFRNFMVGTSFAKTESVMTAVIGTLFFAAPLSAFGWIAVVLGVIGVWLMAVPDRNEPWSIYVVCLGLGSGACFALTSLWIRQASLSLGIDVMTSAAITLVLVVTFQSLLCLLYTVVVTPEEFLKITASLPLALFVGATSALGSIGWFTAMSWQNPALVKSLGQIEILFTAMLTLRFFRERIRVVECLGVAMLVFSVVILVQFSEQL